MDGELKEGEVCLDSGRQAAKDYIPRECVSTASPERLDSSSKKKTMTVILVSFCFIFFFLRFFLILPRGPQIKAKNKK